MHTHTQLLMVERVAKDPFDIIVCVDAIFMVSPVPNSLNIQFSTLPLYDECSKPKEHPYSFPSPHTHTHTQPWEREREQPSPENQIDEHSAHQICNVMCLLHFHSTPSFDTCIQVYDAITVSGLHVYARTHAIDECLEEVLSIRCLNIPNAKHIKTKFYYMFRLVLMLHMSTN